MNREIKFRGKRIDNGEWISGHLYRSELKAWITDSRNINLETHKNIAWFQVIPETVGRFFGEQDETGIDIYQYDIVDVCVFLVSPENPDNDQHFRGWISFERGCFMLNIKHYRDYYNNKGELIPLQPKHLPFCNADLNEDGSFSISLYDFMGISGNLNEFISDNIEVVGNIFENK